MTANPFRVVTEADLPLFRQPRINARLLLAFGLAAAIAVVGIALASFVQSRSLRPAFVSSPTLAAPVASSAGAAIFFDANGNRVGW